MVVRLRFKRPVKPAAKRAQIARVAEIRRAAPATDPNLVTRQEMAGGLATLLSPASALALALTLWRLGQDMGFARSFFISEGPLSHWQVWFGICVFLQCASHRLSRSARGSGNEPATN